MLRYTNASNLARYVLPQANTRITQKRTCAERAFKCKRMKAARDRFHTKTREGRSPEKLYRPPPPSIYAYTYTYILCVIHGSMRASSVTKGSYSQNYSNYHQNGLTKCGVPVKIPSSHGMPVKTQRGPKTRSKRVVSTTLRPLYRLQRPAIHCIGSWVGLGTGLDGSKVSVYAQAL